jgi:AcrR family transcriptional regulator
MKVMDQPRKTGRPLSFDRDEVLQKAMLQFWAHGYETTSISDLTAVMGVTAPSIYTAFGDKKRLFLDAVKLYAGEPLQAVQIIDAAPTARAAVAGLLTSAAIGYTGEITPPGCLLASAVASCSAGSADVQAAIADIRGQIESRLRAKIADALKGGEIVPGIDPASLAGTIMAVIQGMAILARDGATREKLLAIANTCMAAWPGNEK